MAALISDTTNNECETTVLDDELALEAHDYYETLHLDCETSNQVDVCLNTFASVNKRNSNVDDNMTTICISNTYDNNVFTNVERDGSGSTEINNPISTNTYVRSDNVYNFVPMESCDILVSTAVVYSGFGT